MAFVPFPNTALFEVLYLSDGQRVENTLYFDLEGGWTSGDLESMCAALLDYWTANMIPLQSNQVTLLGVEGTALDSSEGAFGAVYAPTPVVGGHTADVEPNNVTFAITFFTGFQGRSRRGRNFWIGIPVDNVSLSEVGSSYIADVLEAYTGIVTGIPSATGDWVVASRFTDGAARVVGLTTPVAGVRVADLVVDSQRRRLPGRGR